MTACRRGALAHQGSSRERWESVERVHGEAGEMVQMSGWQSRWLYCQHQSKDSPVCNAEKIPHHGLLMCPVHDAAPLTVPRNDTHRLSS